MLRFKTFNAADAKSLEEQVNEWLMQSEPDVRMMEQGASPTGTLVVSFLYDEGFMASEQRISVQASEIVENALHQPQVLEPIQVDQESV